MPTYLSPGVKIEEIPSGARTIEGVETSTALFVGFALKGEVGKPVLLAKWSDYEDEYGGLRNTARNEDPDYLGYSVRAYFINGGKKCYVVRLAEAGKDQQGAITKPLSRSWGYIRHPADAAKALRFEAPNEGDWANGIAVNVEPKSNGAGSFKLEVGRLQSDGSVAILEKFNDVSLVENEKTSIDSVLEKGSVHVRASIVAMSDIAAPPAGYQRGTLTSGAIGSEDLDFSEASEQDRKLRLRLDGGTTNIDVVLEAKNYAGRLAKLADRIQSEVRAAGGGEAQQGFTCVATADKIVLTSGTRTPASGVEAPAPDGTADAADALKLSGDDEVAKTGTQTAEEIRDGRRAELWDGANGRSAGTAAYQSLFEALEKYRDVNTICLTDHPWTPDDIPYVDIAVAHAEKVRRCMVIVDPDPEAELMDETGVTDQGFPTSTYTAMYYPWLKVANPFYHAEDNPGAPHPQLIPPSGFAAGMWAKIDGRRGVWKTPGGVETRLQGLTDLNFQVEEAEQDALNPNGVNCVREFPGYGSVIWGGRTLATKADPEWRYVAVRRTALFIEASILNGIQWSVFEGNDHRLWSALRASIGSFMDGLFRAGAFQGAKASEAYFVRCGIPDTMTQADVDRGQVIVVVGFAPLKPAEFVIVRIQQKVGEQ